MPHLPPPLFHLSVAVSTLGPWALPAVASARDAIGVRSEARVCRQQAREGLEMTAALRSRTELRREPVKAPTRSEAACPSEILSRPGGSRVALIISIRVNNVDRADRVADGVNLAAHQC